MRKKSCKEKHWPKVYESNLLEYYSGNIEMQNVNRFKQDINMLSYSVYLSKRNFIKRPILM